MAPGVLWFQAPRADLVPMFRAKMSWSRLGHIHQEDSVALAPRKSNFPVTAMLCDGAAAADGKLYLHGAGWDMISPPNGAYPSRIPRVGLGMLIVVPFTATDRQHRMKISLTGANGEKIALGVKPVDPSDPASNGTVPMYHVEVTFDVGRGTVADCPDRNQPGQRGHRPARQV
jgi:hypothetical protein